MLLVVVTECKWWVLCVLDWLGWSERH